MIKELFDRENERYILKTFLESNDSFFIITGESGVGKSSIINNSILKNFNLEEILEVSFKPNSNLNYFVDKEDFLKEKLHSLYKNYRKKNIGVLKDTAIKFKNKLSTVSTGIGVSGPVLGFGFANGSNENIVIDRDYIIQFDKILYKNPYRIIYFSNIELSKKNDLEIIELFFNLVNEKKLNIKVIFEIGTLNNTNSSFLKELIDKHHLLIEPFNEYFTGDFYKFYHKTKPPIELFAKTKGNPFYIVHYSKNINNFVIMDLIKSKLSLLDENLLVIVYTLHILGGATTKNKISQYTDINSNSLLLKIEQLELHEILVHSKNNISFLHSFFSLFIDKRNSGLLEELSLRIKDKLLANLRKIEDDEIILLMNLLYKTREKKVLKKVGWYFARKAYKEQKYNLTILICKMLIEVIDNKNLITFPSLLLIQSSILIGNAQNNLKYLKNYLSVRSDDKVLISAIKAQLLYQENKFQDSINEIEKALIDIDDFRLETILLGLNCSNYIALGNFQKAKVNFYHSKTIAETLENKEVLFELYRLSPKILGWEVGKKLIFSFTNNSISSNYEYTKYKSLHNLGFANIITTHGEQGLKELLESKNYFEKNYMPELTYSIVGLSVYLLLNEALDDTIFYLLDGCNFIHEQYDAFAIYTNLANVYLLKNKTREAEKYYLKAFNILNNKVKPLTDPVLVYKANYNLALMYLVLGDFPKANKFYKKISIPSTASFYNERLKKNDWLINTIKKKNKKIDLINTTYTKESWPVSKFSFAIAKLSFFDLNLKIITEDNLPKKL